MSKVIADITMSLDGYVTGPSGDVDELHAWVTDQDAVDYDPGRRWARAGPRVPS